jgi:hypothetical protein
MQKNTLPLILAACSILPVQAQLWCLPGAEWSANLFGLAMDGCETAVYVGDTVFEGRTAQHIAVTDIVMNYLYPPQDTVQWNLYTSVQDSMVFQWTDTEGWDTLFWFNAVPGDRWYPPGMPILASELCNAVQVTDTSQVDINGYSLRKLTCAFLDQSGAITSFTFNITERLGTGSMHFPSGACVTDEGAWGPHTYMDAAFPLWDNGTGSGCDQFSGITDSPMASDLSVFPNPGTDILQIETGTKGAMNVCMRDALGRVVLNASGATGSLELSSASLLPGIYFIAVNTAKGPRTVKWVKS